MKEISDIINAYHTATSSGRKMALATVVHVEGSSYRRPGARMLVTDEGQLTGAISGGCLEGDALRKALLAISQQKNKLVTYDTTDDNDNKLGVQLGCNGIVHILFEPIHTDNPDNPIELLKKAVSRRQKAVVATLFSLQTRTGSQPGTCFLHLEGDQLTTNHCPDDHIAGQLSAKATQAYALGDSFFRSFGTGSGALHCFVEFLNTPPALVVAGAGNDTIPLVEMARTLGWEVTVVDGRAGHATIQRFPRANKVIVAKADQVLDHVEVDQRTFFLLMTHNYYYDLALLKHLIFVDQCRYVGALGPKKKLERMYADLLSEGITITEQQKEKIFGPVGLDLGAETSEEIALSVLAEIKAVLHGRTGLSLRDKKEPIHDRDIQQTDYERPEENEGFLCAVQTISN